jgi:hypothetical protein
MAHERIEINPDIMGGKPVIRGTRIPVETILRKLGAGMTVEATKSPSLEGRRLSSFEARFARTSG